QERWDAVRPERLDRQGVQGAPQSRVLEVKDAREQPVLRPRQATARVLRSPRDEARPDVRALAGTQELPFDLRHEDLRDAGDPAGGDATGNPQGQLRDRLR